MTTTDKCVQATSEWEGDFRLQAELLRARAHITTVEAKLMATDATLDRALLTCNTLNEDIARSSVREVEASNKIAELEQHVALLHCDSKSSLLALQGSGLHAARLEVEQLRAMVASRDTSIRNLKLQLRQVAEERVDQIAALEKAVAALNSDLTHLQILKIAEQRRGDRLDLSYRAKCTDYEARLSDAASARARDAEEIVEKQRSLRESEAFAESLRVELGVAHDALRESQASIADLVLVNDLAEKRIEGANATIAGLTKQVEDFQKVAPVDSIWAERLDVLKARHAREKLELVRQIDALNAQIH